MSEKNINPNNDFNTRPETGRSNEVKLEMNYNCPNCSSLIEIININEENNKIKFKCLSKEEHSQEMPLKEYFEKMEKFKNKENEDLCKLHGKNNKYINFCFDCDCHLCPECLKMQEHFYHEKNSIIEIQPISEELNILEEVIDYYKNKIEYLKNEKLKKEKELDKIKMK